MLCCGSVQTLDDMEVLAGSKRWRDRFPSFICNPTQSGSFSGGISSLMPTLLRRSMIWRVAPFSKHDRPLLPLEHFAVQAIPVRLLMPEWAALGARPIFPDDNDTDNAEKAVAGVAPADPTSVLLEPGVFSSMDCTLFADSQVKSLAGNSFNMSVYQKILHFMLMTCAPSLPPPLDCCSSVDLGSPKKKRQLDVDL